MRYIKKENAICTVKRELQMRLTLRKCKRRNIENDSQKDYLERNITCMYPNVCLSACLFLCLCVFLILSAYLSFSVFLFYVLLSLFVYVACSDYLSSTLKEFIQRIFKTRPINKYWFHEEIQLSLSIKIIFALQLFTKSMQRKLTQIQTNNYV